MNPKLGAALTARSQSLEHARTHMANKYAPDLEAVMRIYRRTNTSIQKSSITRAVTCPCSLHEEPVVAIERHLTSKIPGDKQRGLANPGSDTDRTITLFRTWSSPVQTKFLTGDLDSP